MLEARKHRGNQYTSKSAAAQNGMQQKSREDIKSGTAGEIAREQHMSNNTVIRAEKFAKGVDKGEEVSSGFKEGIQGKRSNFVLIAC